MINLEEIHKAMNSNDVLNVVNSLMFEWTFEEEEGYVEEHIEEVIVPLCRMIEFQPTEAQLLAIKALFNKRIQSAEEKGEWRIQ